MILLERELLSWYICSELKSCKSEGAEWMKNDTVHLDGCMVSALPVFGLPKSFHLCSITMLMVPFLWALHVLRSEHVRLLMTNVYLDAKFAFSPVAVKAVAFSSSGTAKPTVEPLAFYLKDVCTTNTTTCFPCFLRHFYIYLESFWAVIGLLAVSPTVKMAKMSHFLSLHLLLFIFCCLPVSYSLQVRASERHIVGTL